MGAKTPAKLGINRTRRLQCHICHRSFQNIQGLRSHQICLHKIKTVNRAGHLLQKRKIAIKNNRQLRLKNNMPVESTTMPNDDEKKNHKTNMIEMRKIEFGCPKCSKMFPVYFSALRHIQKHHSVIGQKISSNSTNAIKPIRYELCAKCDKKINPSLSHTCGSENIDELGSKTAYVCLGCDQRYSSIHLFDLHLSTLHSKCVESMFLPTFNEFMNWKRQLEMQTKTKYRVLGNSNIKQIGRCTYESKDENTDTVLLCPSSIVIQEFSKGIQVHYYKEHYGHSCNDYKLSEKFKKFSITNLMKNAELYMNVADDKSDEDDLYVQFKNLMSCIVLDAAKINITALKVLHGKALEMTSILNNYDEDDELMTNVTSCDSRIVLTPKSTVKMSDDQITDELEGTRSSQRIKRRINDIVTPKVEKKIKTDDSNSSVNEKNNIQTSSENDVKSEIENEETSESSTKKTETESMNRCSPKLETKPVIQSPSSFNDSYKNFVDTTFKTIPDKTSTPTRKTRNSSNVIKDTKKKVIMKTKMGQFIPNTSPTKKGQESANIKDIHKTNIEEDSTVDTTPKSNILKSRLTSKSSDIIKPGFAPKQHILKSSYISKVRSLPDFEYEVKEQENDCNILILKI